VVSLTLTPMMCARMLPPHAAAHGAPGLLDRIIARYGRWLDWVLLHQRLALLATLATLALTAALYLTVPKGFFPVQDNAAIQAVTEAPQSISFAAMAERQQALAAGSSRIRRWSALSSFIGVDGTNSTLNSGRMLINLKPHGRAQGEGRRNHRPAAHARPAKSRASRSTCSRCRS
jgi:multidrug efflux pump